jgi:hypothetical protein
MVSLIEGGIVLVWKLFSRGFFACEVVVEIGETKVFLKVGVLNSGQTCMGFVFLYG